MKSRTLKATVVIILFIGATLSGCYQSVTLKTVPPNSDALFSTQHSKRLPPAYLLSIQVELNGAATNVSPTFEQRFVGRLQEIGLFKDVVGTIGREKRADEPHYKLFLKASEIQHLDRAGNAIKGFFVGLSLYVLSPVLPFDYGHEVNMSLSVQKPNGIEKKYYSNAKSSALYTMTHTQTAILKAQGEAVEKCIISIMNQLTADSDLGTF